VREDQEQRSYLRRAQVRLRMAGWERGEEWGRCKRVWSSLPTIWMGGKRGNSAGRRWRMCGHWQGGGRMGCRMWLGFEGGVRYTVVGQGVSKGIVQV